MPSDRVGPVRKPVRSLRGETGEGPENPPRLPGPLCGGGIMGRSPQSADSMPIRSSLRRLQIGGTVTKISAVVPDELGATLEERARGG